MTLQIQNKLQESVWIQCDGVWESWCFDSLGSRSTHYFLASPQRSFHFHKIVWWKHVLNRMLFTNLLNKAGDVAARLFKPSSDGFIVKTTWRLFITWKQSNVNLKICLQNGDEKKKDKLCVILLWLILTPSHFQFNNCCSFSEKESKSTHFKWADSLQFFLKIISLTMIVYLHIHPSSLSSMFFNYKHRRTLRGGRNFSSNSSPKSSPCRCKYSTVRKKV